MLPKRISRREFIYIASVMSLAHQVPALSSAEAPEAFVLTVETLRKALISETIAHRHYLAFTQKALQDGFSNIAYLFHAFSFSEKNHADNYCRILLGLGHKIAELDYKVGMDDTKTNLEKAAARELEKIENTYPGFLDNLKGEAHAEAIINCIYSWESHRQHEAEIRKIMRYTPMFFGAVSREIESSELDFHVCRICGSTIDERPVSNCQICGRPAENYQRISRPA